VSFVALLNRFCGIANTILIGTEAWIDKLVGDEVIGFLHPWFWSDRIMRNWRFRQRGNCCKPQDTAIRLAPGFQWGSACTPGVAFLGVVGAAEGHIDITALGDNVNITARLLREPPRARF